MFRITIHEHLSSIYVNYTPCTSLLLSLLLYNLTISIVKHRCSPFNDSKDATWPLVTWATARGRRPTDSTNFSAWLNWTGLRIGSISHGVPRVLVKYAVPSLGSFRISSASHIDVYRLQQQWPGVLESCAQPFAHQSSPARGYKHNGFQCFKNTIHKKSTFNHTSI